MLYLRKTTIELKNDRQILSTQSTVTYASPSDWEIINLIKSLLFYPTDHKVQDFRDTLFSKSQDRTTEKDASPYAVKKGFLEVDSDAVDHREDETGKTDKVDEDLKTTVSQTDISG